MIAVLTPSLTGEFIEGWYKALSASIGDTEYTIYTCTGKPILEARNKTTTAAYQNKEVSHFLFLDDDILPSPLGIQKLLEADKPIIGGVCCYKTTPYKAVFANLNTKNEMYDFDPKPKYPSTPFEVDATGFGCLLVKREVLEAIGYKDWFRWDWIRNKSNGRAYRFAGGEDVWWCEKAKLHGYKVFIDPKCRCLHVSRTSGKIYPKSLEAKFWKRFD